MLTSMALVKMPCAVRVETALALFTQFFVCSNVHSTPVYAAELIFSQPLVRGVIFTQPLLRGSPMAASVQWASEDVDQYGTVQRAVRSLS